MRTPIYSGSLAPETYVIAGANKQNIPSIPRHIETIVGGNSGRHYWYRKHLANIWWNTIFVMIMIIECEYQIRISPNGSNIRIRNSSINITIINYYKTVIKQLQNSCEELLGTYDQKPCNLIEPYLLFRLEIVHNYYY